MTYDNSLGPNQQLPPQTASPTNVSAIVLIVVAAVTGTLIPAIFGIIALVKQGTDPAGSRKMAKIGWIVFAVMVVLYIIAIVLFIVFVVAVGGFASTSTFSTSI